jgi:RsiW-degrading membrane proteinase PrsW (M82 family)
VSAAPSAPSWKERGSLLRPRAPAFWMFAFLLTIGALGEAGVIAGRVSAAPSSSLFAITLLIVWAVPLVVVIHALDLFEQEPFAMLAAAFAWGALAATTLAISANTALLDLIAKLGSQPLADRWGAAIAGPIDEETLKALGLMLLVLIAAAEIDTPIDGLIYGAFIGLGFQILEDFQYLTNPSFSGDGLSQTHVVWELFLVRGLIGGIWSHAAYTGLVGLGVGYLVSRPEVPRARRIALACLAFAGAVSMHFVWNSPWLENLSAGGFWRTIMTQSVSKGLPGFLLLIWLYLRARRRESRWVEHVLSPETAWGAATPDEIEALLTFHGRRHERRAAKRLAGASGARRTKELQRQQIGLAVALTRSAGSTTPEIEQRRQAIASLREKIRAAAAAQGPRGGTRS